MSLLCGAILLLPRVRTGRRRVSLVAQSSARMQLQQLLESVRLVRPAACIRKASILLQI